MLRLIEIVLNFQFYEIHIYLRGLQPLERKKISKKYNIGVIDLKFTQYIPTMGSDIVYK